MSDRIKVEHAGQDRFVITVRGHEICIDQPAHNRGQDTAPTPTELFTASLAGCVAFYGRRYLARHEVPTDGFRVDASYAAGGRPNRITDIDIRVTPAHGLPPERRDAFGAVLSGCTLHHTLQQPPSVAITSDALAVSRPYTGGGTGLPPGRVPPPPIHRRRSPKGAP